MKYILLFILTFILSEKSIAQKLNVKTDPYLKTEVRFTDNEKLYEKLIQRVFVNLTKIDSEYIFKFEKYNGDLMKFDVYSIAKNDLGIILLKSGDTVIIKSTSYQNPDIQYNASEYRHQYYISESSLNKMMDDYPVSIRFYDIKGSSHELLWKESKSLIIPNQIRLIFNLPLLEN
jgi:hypothetical protein